MSLTLYLHPLASFCHKVLIAFYERGIAFEGVTVDFHDPGSAAALFEKWPVGKIPVLHDNARDCVVPETSVIIEYVEEHFPGSLPMLPAEPQARLDARLWDRFFDFYVSIPMQKIVTNRLRPERGNDPVGVADAHNSLDAAYAMLEGQLAGKRWVTGDPFTLADCSAAPALFYASIVHPFGADQVNLAAYFERLLERPSVRRTIVEARPYFPNFPYRDAMPERFLRDWWADERAS